MIAYNLYLSTYTIYFLLSPTDAINLLYASKYSQNISLFSIIFTTYMQGRADHYFKNSRSRRTEEDIDLDLEQPVKVSTHIQPHKKDHPFPIQRKHQESSQNSRLKDSRTGSGFGSVLGSRVGRVLRVSKNEKDKNVVTDIEFNNVRWISIVSAYDSKRLRHVTVSKQSCQQFLKKYGYGVKKDPTAMAYFKDIKKHFYSWLSKVNQTFVSVLSHFLTGSEKSPLSELQKVNPILEEVRSDTAMMKEKLEGCLKYYENQDFRKMAEKFKGFFLFSSKLQEIIGIIFEKKERIDSLFFELQGAGNVDRSIEKIRKQGVKQAKKLIYNDSKNINLCDRIMQKVTHAINDMASKGLNLFHKLLGAKNLISRIRKILNDAHRRLTIKQIRQFSEIFREVLDQTAKFQEFVDQFDAQSDFVTVQLREKIHLCRQQLMTKKRAVGQMQNIFVSTVINETIDVLHNSHSLSNALTQAHIPYQQYNHLLQAIADAMLDETSRTITQGLTKQNRIAFARLEEELQKISRSLKRHSQGFVIDTEDGQVASMECAKLTKVYKDKIKQLIKKHQDTLRHLHNPVRQMRLPAQERDQEIIFLNKLVNVSEVVNKREWHQRIIEERGFHELKEGVAQSAAQVEHTENILKEFQTNSLQIKKLNAQSPLKQLIREIRTQNSLYIQSHYLLEMFRIVARTSQKSIIQNLRQMKSINSKRIDQLEDNSNYKQSKAYRYVLDRLYCFILVKGLKKTAIKEIDDPKGLMFPENQFQQKQMENQVKYRSLIWETLAEEAYLAKNRLKVTISVMKDLINSKILIDKLRSNEKGQYVALTAVLSNYSIQLFKLCLVKPKSEGLSSEARKIVLQLCKCLKSKSMNIDILEGQLDVQSYEAALRVRKQFIHFKNINEDAVKTCQDLSKTQGNDPLDTLSNVIHTIAEYLRLTNQPVYLALNQWKQPVWIGPPSQGKVGIANLIQLDGYPRGTFVNQYCHEAPKIYDQKEIKTIKPLSPSNNPAAAEMPRKSSSNIIVKVKSHPKESMDEEILAIESDKQLNEEMNEDIPDEEMGEEIVQDNEMGEEVIEDNQMSEDIIEDNQMGEDIVDEEEMQQKMDQQIDEQSKVILPKVELKKEITSSNKNNSQKKIQEKQIQTSVYEVIPFFRELQQIYALIQQIHQTQSLFWKENTDFQEIEDYYHRKEDLKDRNNFIKSLQNCFSMYLGSRFGPKLAEAIKGLDKLKAIKGVFLSLAEKNWNKLFEVLAITQRNYSILIDHRSQVKQVFSYAGDSHQFKRHRCKKCIKNFLDRTFKSAFFLDDQFEYEEYIGTCLKTEIEELVNDDGVSFHYIVRFRAKCDETLPGDDIDSKMKQIKQIESKFEHQMITGINIELSCLQFWVKAIASNSQDCYKPDYSILDGYIKQLSKVEQKQSIIHYQEDFRDQMLDIKSKVQSHKKSVVNLFFKVDNTNVLEYLEQLASLYANTALTKVVIRKNNSQLIPIWISRQQKEGVLNETSASQLISELFRNFKANAAFSQVKEDKIIDVVQGICKKGGRSAEEMSYLMATLNILEIQHFFINKPQFVFKKNQEELILTILRPLRINNLQEIRYNELLQDIFTVSKRQYSTELIVNKNINHNAFTERCVRQNTETLKDIQAKLSRLSEDFRKKMKDIDMSQLLPDCLNNRTSQNTLLNAISQHAEQLQHLQKFELQKINDKQSNLLLYVHTYIAASDKLSSLIDQAITQVSPMQINFKNAKDISSHVESIDKLFSEIRLWAKSVSLSKQLTTYIIVSEEKQWTVNLQLAISLDERQRSKEYLQSLLKRCWIPTEGWKSTWNLFFERYIAKKIKIQIGAGGISCIYYNLQAAIKKIIEDVRLQLAQPSDVIEFVKNFNIHRFTHSIQASDLANKLHYQISQRLQLKQQLVYFKTILRNNKFQVIDNFQIAKSLLNCLEQQLDIAEQELDSIILQTNALKGKQIGLQQIINWYRALAHAKLGCHYYELRSSNGTPIAVLPQIKLDKDKSKNHEEISALLKDIKISTEFSTKLQKRVHIVQLEPQVIHCFIRDTEKYLSSDKQIKTFQPELAQGQMLVLMIQQDDGQSIPLWVSTLQLSVKVPISITDNRTTGSISCAIWRIGIQDYQGITKDNIDNQDEQTKMLKKKLRGLASPEEKIKDVRIGQEIFFDSVGEWLKEEVKKHQNRVQERERAEQERLRLLELQRKEEEAFLNSIQDELRKENILTMKIQLAEVKQKSQEISQSKFEIEGFYRKLATKTIKIIEKLEENKPLEEVSRLDLVKRTYIYLLQAKLASNYQIQQSIRDKAELKFAAILKDRQLQRKKKKQEKAKKRAQEKAKKEAEEKAKQEALAAVNNADGNVLNIPSNAAELQPSINDQFPQHEMQQGNHSGSQSAEQIKEVDIIQILMQRTEVNNQKLEAFLIQWLQSQEPKDGDYYRCLLDEFCQLNAAQMQGMSELK